MCREAHLGFLFGESCDQVGVLRVLSTQYIAVAELEISVIKTWRDGAAHERPTTAGDEAATLPDAGGHNVLRFVPGREVVVNRDDTCFPAWPELQHFHGVAGVEVEDFIALDDVNGGEGFGREQVVDAGRGGAVAGIRRRRNHQRCAVRFAKVTAFDGKRLQAETLDDYCCAVHLFIHFKTHIWQGEFEFVEVINVVVLNGFQIRN